MNLIRRVNMYSRYLINLIIHQNCQKSFLCEIKAFQKSLLYATNPCNDHKADGKKQNYCNFTIKIVTAFAFYNSFIAFAGSTYI